MQMFLPILFAFMSALSALSTEGKPHVLFVSVDDLNDWIGCLDGHPQALTPNMDRLASRGILFANAHCASPACNPSRSTVFSGLMPQRTGVWSNLYPKFGSLNPNAMGLVRAFSKAGFKTMGTGKLSGDKATRYDESFNTAQRWSPLPQGAVKYSLDELPSKGTTDPRHITKDLQGNSVVLPLNRMPSDRRPHTTDGESFDWGPFDVPDADFGDTRITDWALNKILEGFESPTFLGIGYYRPHIPLYAPKRFFARFEEDPGQLPKVLKDDIQDLTKIGKRWAVEADTAGLHYTVVKNGQWRRAVESYLACITYIDNEIGRLMDVLDKSSASSNTWIVLWSDHGWHLGEKMHWGKWTPWERSTRVPLIIVPPKKLETDFAIGGSVCIEPVSLIDLYPTLVELCDLPRPPVLDGHSLVPLLRDPLLKTDRVVVTMFDKGNLSLRTRQWRYIRYTNGDEELYDLSSDTNEWTNLVANKDYSYTLFQLRKRADRELKRLSK